ncbi:MAG: carboxypeptidase regulatory-like domain-containing protein, partial [Proteobacteria bacterium]|nr:carboxypeptidase regulatory-like domain-containing protein [Pseudomonadota bacterium]
GLEYDYGEDARIRLPVPENLILRMMLKPKPSYPFPPGATLIRGKVYDSAGEAVSGAKVRVRGKDVENKTTEKGEFVLYFGPLTEDEIIRVDGKRFVKGNGGKTLHPEVDLFSIDAEFEEDLNNGIISEKLKDIFKTKGFPLSENAMVTKEKENEWVITNEKKFIVRKEKGKLNIYLEPEELEAEEGKTTSVIINEL